MENIALNLRWDHIASLRALDVLVLFIVIRIMSLT